MRKWAGVLGAALAAACLHAGAACAQTAQGMQLYVFTSGALSGFPKSALQIGGGDTIMDWVPVGFYVIKHPKGNILFDTGNNDKTIADAEGWWGPLAKAFGLKMTKDDAIPVQLEKIGLKPEDIKYVILAHMHLDHGGNVSQFPDATFVVQDDEMKAAWWPDVGYSVYYIPGDFQDTKKYNMVRLNGDLDLFGDGSVTIHRAPGHTPGSQFAVVKLPNTGPVILTSDVVYFEESLEKNRIPPIPGTWSPMDMYESYQKIRLIRDGLGARVSYAHDPEVFKATKQAPEFYD